MTVWKRERISCTRAAMRDVLPLCSLFLLGRKEAGALAGLEKECFSLPWSLAQYEKILPDEGRFLGRVSVSGSGRAFADDFFAVPAPGRAGLMPVVGVLGSERELMAFLSLGLNRAAAELEVYNIAVRSRYRRFGLARLLLGPVLIHASRHGFTSAFLEVREGNAPALSLYASLGFTTVGRRKGYYADNGEDALIMTCPLAEPDADPSKPLT